MVGVLDWLLVNRLLNWGSGIFRRVGREQIIDRLETKSSVPITVAVYISTDISNYLLSMYSRMELTFFVTWSKRARNHENVCTVFSRQ